MEKKLTFIGSIFSKKILKKILGFLVLIGIGTLLFSKNDVFAQSTNNLSDSTNTQITKVQEMSEINELFTYISRTIYALLWPVLFIAGIALDNRLVYGSFLHLDASLWTLWNIMKNFANFALGFMVLFAIVKNIFTAPFGKSGDKWGPVSIIKKTLIAGVLIQASWFLMAAVIDVSTILTYSIGGLPMTVMQNNPKQANLPILGVNAILSTKGDNNKMNLQYYNTYGDKKISPCKVKKIPSLTGDYIVGREQIFIASGVSFEKGYCTLGGWPYSYLENDEYSSFSTDNHAYTEGLNNYFSSGSSISFSGLLEQCTAIPTSFSELNSGCVGQGYGILSKDDKFFTDATENNNIKYTIDNLLDKSKGFVGPFITIYSSLLDFSSLATDPTGEDGVVADFLNLVIKLFFAVILFFPLLVLAVVLIVRIGILWLVIAASPILVLIKVFEDVIKIGGKSDGFMGHFEGSNIVKMIFAPVFVVFAISMSMIFLSALNPKDVSKSAGLGSDQMAELGMEKIEEDTYSILGLVEITLDIEKVDKGMDMFAWFITMFFATGIVWFFLFFAIRMTKIGETVGKGLQESVQNLAKNLPIIPIGGGSVGLEAAKGGLSAVANKIPTKLKGDQEAMLREKYPWLYPGSTDADRGETGSGEFHGMDIGLQTKIFEAKNSGKDFNTIFTENKAALTAAGITSATVLETSYNNIYNYNTESIVKKEDTDVVTTFEAQKYTSESISLRANQKDSKWNSWAKGAVGSNVQTNEGVYVMTNVGTFTTPQFKLLTPEEYNTKYLKQKNGQLDQAEMRKEFAKDYSNSQPKPDNVDQTKWNDDKNQYIDEQIAKHMENAKKRLKIDNSGSNNNNQDTPPADQTNPAGGSDNIDSDAEK